MAAKSPGSSKPSPAKQLDDFIAKFDPAVAKLIYKCRTAVRKLLPTAIELVYDNYNFLAIGYAATERASSRILSVAAAANGVILSFYYGSTLPDPNNILLGSGKQNRFIRLPTTAPLSWPEVLALIQAAVDQADPPLPSSGKGYTVIKSISAKQRPRRKDPKPG